LGELYRILLNPSVLVATGKARVWLNFAPTKIEFLSEGAG